MSKHQRPIEPRLEPPLDPSHFGTIEISAELRARLLSLDLPRVPREQLENTAAPLQHRRQQHASRSWWACLAVAAVMAALAAVVWLVRR